MKPITNQEAAGIVTVAFGVLITTLFLISKPLNQYDTEAHAGAAPTATITASVTETPLEKKYRIEMEKAKVRTEQIQQETQKLMPKVNQPVFTPEEEQRLVDRCHDDLHPPGTPHREEYMYDRD